MAITTKKQLKERWLTPEGKRIIKNIVGKICDHNWERDLKGFPYVSEVNNNKDLRYIDLSFQDFLKASMKYLGYGELVGPNFFQTNLTGADLTGAQLSFANLEGAIINNTSLITTSLMRSNLAKATIKDSDFMGSNLWGSDLSSSSIINTNLYGCNLTNTNLSSSKILNCEIYGISAWNIKRNQQTMMRDLIISKDRYKDPLITVDDMEIAQFIYSLLNNEKIRNMVDTMRTKGVLILGSFCDDKKNKITPKKVLDKIKEELLKKNYVPIVFDFDPSKKLDLISTVKTLALLSSFIIVDLSTPAGQLIEIGNLVREFPIPFIPIASNKTEHITGMVSKKALGNYHWFKKDIIYYLLDDFDKQLPEVIESNIIPWVKNKNRELEKERED